MAAADELDLSLNTLPPPALLSGMADFLAEAVTAGRRLLVVADFDADGATACAVAMRGLRLLGASQVDYLVPTRADGYGLTPEIVALDTGIGVSSMVRLGNAAQSRAGDWDDDRNPNITKPRQSLGFADSPQPTILDIAYN